MTGLWGTIQELLLGIIPILLAWLVPSPLQRAARKQEKTHEAERKADASRGDVSDLDELP